RPLGAGLGCGVVAVLPPASCGVRETAGVMAWMAGESAGQCGPCEKGLPAIAGALGQLAGGVADASTVARLHRWAAQVEGRGGCSLPDGAVQFLRSALRVFAEDVRRHLH